MFLCCRGGASILTGTWRLVAWTFFSYGHFLYLLLPFQSVFISHLRFDLYILYIWYNFIDAFIAIIIWIKRKWKTLCTTRRSNSHYNETKLKPMDQLLYHMQHNYKCPEECIGYKWKCKVIKYVVGVLG